MRWLLRLFLWLLGIGVLLLLAGAGYALVRSEWILRESHAPPLDAVPVPRDAQSIAEGARMYRVMTCGTCHGAEGKGRMLIDSAAIGRVAAPALARAAAGRTDKDLVRAIRYGVHADGRSLYLMNVDTYAALSDEDLGRIIGWIRTLRPTPRDRLPRLRMGLGARLMLATGDIVPVARVDTISQPHRPPDLGRYLVETSCATCHDLDNGRQLADGSSAPPLGSLGQRYRAEEFKALMRTGIGLNFVRMPMMSMLAQNHYDALHDDEIAAIYGYLSEPRRQ